MRAVYCTASKSNRGSGHLLSDPEAVFEQVIHEGGRFEVALLDQLSQHRAAIPEKRS